MRKNNKKSLPIKELDFTALNILLLLLSSSSSNFSLLSFGWEIFTYPGM